MIRKTIQKTTTKCKRKVCVTREYLNMHEYAFRNEKKRNKVKQKKGFFYQLNSSLELKLKISNTRFVISPNNIHKLKKGNIFQHYCDRLHDHLSKVKPVTDPTHR